MKMSQSEFQALAREGAKAEVERIFAAFPELAAIFTRAIEREAERPRHWTQTPEGRKKMSRVQRRAWAKRRVM